MNSRYKLFRYTGYTAVKMRKDFGIRNGLLITGLTLVAWLCLAQKHSYHKFDFQFLKDHIQFPPLIKPDQKSFISIFDDYDAYLAGHILRHIFSENDLLRRFEINVNGSDIINFLRIQKTGSTTMDLHMQRDIDVTPWCECRGNDKEKCDCFSRLKSNVFFKTAKYDWPCRLHADWTYLQECAETAINKRHKKKIKQRQLYITMVRDPLRRYVSEWLHVKRGATWAGAPYICNGKPATEEEIPLCSAERKWKHVTLHDFMACPSNLAHNRQTRMLANLSLVNCYNTTGMSYEKRHETMLASAKSNLKDMAYFGMTGYQQLSQILFENTFNLHFISKFVDSEVNKTHSGSENSFTEEDRLKIIHLNKYDVMLFQFAKDLFIQRLQRVTKTTNDTRLRDLIAEKLKDLTLQYK